MLWEGSLTDKILGKNSDLGFLTDKIPSSKSLGQNKLRIPEGRNPWEKKQFGILGGQNPWENSELGSLPDKTLGKMNPSVVSEAPVIHLPLVC